MNQITEPDGCSRVHVSSWDQLRIRLEFLINREPEARHVFRGQSNASWYLIPPLFRSTFDLWINPVAGDPEELIYRFWPFIPTLREKIVLDIAIVFAARLKNLSARHDLSFTGEIDEDRERGLLTLGRHFGLSVPALDWTRNPHVAAFFAFDGRDGTKGDFASIWALSMMPQPSCLMIVPNVPGLLREEAQDSVLIELTGPSLDIETALAGIGRLNSLTCFTCPPEVCDEGLQWLRSKDIEKHSVYPEHSESSVFRDAAEELETAAKEAIDYDDYLRTCHDRIVGDSHALRALLGETQLGRRLREILDAAGHL